MGKFLLKENSLTRFLNRFTDCIYLSILWSIASLPLVTVGMASEALYYTVHKCIYGDEGSIWPTFWRSFWQNRRQGTALWLILLPIGLLLTSACYLTFQWCEAGAAHPVVFGAALAASGLVVMWLQFWFAYGARFQDSLKGVLRNTLLISAANFGASFLLMVVFMLIALIVSCLPQLLLMWMLFPGLYGFAAHQVAESLFLKYLPREDPPETSEDL